MCHGAHQTPRELAPWALQRSHTRSTNTFRSFTLAAVLAALPATAFAGRFDTHRSRDRGDRYEHRDDHRGHDRHDDRKPSGQVGIHIGSGSHGHLPAPLPVYEERVWVEPVYRDVTEQVWVAPVVRKIEERVWVADRYDWRDVTRWEYGRRVTRREMVLVDPAHYATVCREVVVVPGRYETVTRRELLCAGHWETRPTRVVVAPPRDYFHFDLKIPIGR